MKYMKMLGIALVASLALTAVVASAASASFTSSSSPVTISGSQTTTHTFTVEGNAVTCTSATFSSASTATPASTVSVTPVYTGCTAFGFAGAHITMNGCKYKFATPVSKVGTVEFDCPTPETKATVFVSTFLTECEVQIGEAGNNKLEDVKFTNLANGDVEVDATVSGITATKTKDVGLCPLNGTGTINNATYTGKTVISGDGAKTITVD